ncbi:MAG: hypothetical protein IJ374_02685, partial [Lachnospiraceae bacterium]|nr:hypothetical protein [Lachnospiraceae bacterium]
MGIVNFWICEIALIISGFIYVYTIEARVKATKRLVFNVVCYVIFVYFVNRLPIQERSGLEFAIRTAG